MWIYQHHPIRSLQDLPEYENLFGFIYKITNRSTGFFYIGKKNFYTCRKKALLRGEKSNDKRRKKYKLLLKESNWLTYWSSSIDVKKDVSILGEDNFTKEIISLSCSSKNLNYQELKYMILNDVLTCQSYNSNIAGRYYKKDVHPSCFQQ
jgi:hypothetical protein